MSDLDDKRLSNNQTRSLLTRMRVLIVTFRIHKFDSNNLSLIIRTRAVNLTFRVKELDFHN